MIELPVVGALFTLNKILTAELFRHWIMWIRIKQHGYQNTEYKAEPVWYSALYAYSACHCLSRLVLNILRVVAATVPSESEFQSWTILWLNTFLRTSSLL